MPKPITWIASSSQSPPASPAIYPQVSAAQNLQIALSGSPATATTSPYSAYFSPVLGTSTIANPMSMAFMPQTTLPYLNPGGITLGTPLYPTYPGISLANRHSFSVPESERNTTTPQTTTEKTVPSMPFEIPWGWY